MIRLSSAMILALSSLSFSQPATAQDETDQRLGTVHFATSCNETAQRRFNRGMRYQHSFWYRQAMEIFEDTLKADPGCAIAHWGIALSLLNNPHNPPPARNLPLGLAAVEKGRALGAKSQRERDYIESIAVFYTDHDKRPHGQRVQAYLKAVDALAQRYPEDDEAQINLAIMLNATASPADKTYAQQLRGASLLDPIFKRQPRHPGVVHYLIHLYDYPPLAQKGLEAAMLYSKIAPAAPHAQHMPSHIFTRVGYWKESVAANIASKKAAEADREQGGQFHASDYMVYAYLQLAQDARALAVVREMTGRTDIDPEAGGTQFAVAAMPARYTVERGDWNGAAALDVRPTRFAHIEAISRFARAVGAARSGKLDVARAEAAALGALRDKLTAAKSDYWAEQVDIQRQVASAWVLYAEGKQDDALKAMSAAADVEDKTEKNVVTPGPIAPARELYGAMLLERGLAKEALAAYEATLAKEPHRFAATIGAARAASKAGDAAKARQHYAALVALGAEADPVRPEVAEARAYMATAR